MKCPSCKELRDQLRDQLGPSIPFLNANKNLIVNPPSDESVFEHKTIHDQPCLKTSLKRLHDPLPGDALTPRWSLALLDFGFKNSVSPAETLGREWMPERTPEGAE